MKLSQLRSALSHVTEGGPGNPEITGIAYDSRGAKPGNLFCAIPGFRTDGHLYCMDAMRHGAVAFVVERADAIPPGRPGLIVENSREALAILSDRFFRSPSQELWMVGVTGTNGKTTTTHLIRDMLQENGMRVGLTGTVHTLIGDQEMPVLHTTPEAPDLQLLLRTMVDSGLNAAVMEVSSHALALSRVDGVRYDVAVFTNLTQDHLDFHRDFEDYFHAKSLLFRRLDEYPAKPGLGPKGAVINADDPHAERLKAWTPIPVLTYAMSAPADIRASDIEIRASGTRFRLTFPEGREFAVETPLSGRFNVQNVLAAAGVAYLKGLAPEAIVSTLSRLRGVPGRFEKIEMGQPFTVIVDYAHTPDGFQNVLQTARELTQRRIGVVFGAGGDRDRGKRPQMGAMTARFADWTMLTADNPRSEDPQAIIQDIAAGITAEGGTYDVELDREVAIAQAVQWAQPGDILLILGKGHESYQIYRDRTIHFDDRETVRKFLKARFH